MATSTTSALKPALTAPPGVISDFSTPNPLFNWNIVLQCVCIVIPSILMIIRCGVRFVLQKQRSMEDLLCIAAWAIFVSYASIIAILVDTGGGMHQWNLTHEQTMKVLYWTNIGQIVYSMSILATKISLLYIYLNIFAPRRWTPRWWVVVGIAIANILFYIGLMGAKIGQCRPREAIWDKTIKNPTCVSLEVVLDTSGAWNTASDVAILACPLLFIWKLKLSREKKLGILAFFCVGVIAPIFSLIGVVYRVRIDASPDLTYYQPRILFFAQAEVTAGLICTCLPVLPRFYRWIRGEKEATFTPSAGGPSYKSDRHRRTAMLGLRSDTEILSSQYVELNDRPAAGGAVQWSDNVATSGQRPDPGEERSRIWKTTEIHVQSEPAEHSGSESSTTAMPARNARTQF